LSEERALETGSQHIPAGFGLLLDPILRTTHRSARRTDDQTLLRWHFRKVREFAWDRKSMLHGNGSVGSMIVCASHRRGPPLIGANVRWNRKWPISGQVIRKRRTRRSHDLTWIDSCLPQAPKAVKRMLCRQHTLNTIRLIGRSIVEVGVTTHPTLQGESTMEGTVAIFSLGLGRRCFEIRFEP
jgi:hypothetical protein